MSGRSLRRRPLGLFDPLVFSQDSIGSALRCAHAQRRSRTDEENLRRIATVQDARRSRRRRRRHRQRERRVAGFECCASRCVSFRRGIRGRSLSPSAGPASPASLAGLSSPQLVRPIPVYAVSSPQLGSTHHSASAAYPSPPPSLPPASSSHEHAASQTVSSRVLSPPPAPSPALSRGFSTSSGYPGARAAGSVTPTGQQDVITETDPSSELIELEGKLSVGIDFGSVLSLRKSVVPAS